MDVNTVQCSDWRDLLSALDDHSADMLLIDMPYGTTACSWDTVIDLEAWWVEAHRVAKPRAAIVCTGSQPFTSRLVMSNAKRFRYEWIVEKQKATGFLDARRKPLKAHENIMVFSGKPATYYPQGLKPVKNHSSRKNKAGNGCYGKVSDDDYWQRIGGFPQSVQRFDWPTHNIKHPTQKPVALFEYLIRTYTRPGDLVLDPFVGSGTTALAARNTGRRFIVGDQSPEYVQIARDRLAEPFTPDMFDTLPSQDDEPGPVQGELWDAES